MKQPALTIFTPAFNRAHTLPVLYDSLCSQSCKDFEWILVDDGSTDNTRELAESWEAEGKININYYYQPNSGKMAAHNLAVDKSDAKWFMCLDSDDHLSEDVVVETCIMFIRQNLESGSSMAGYANGICGVITLKKVGGNVNTFPEGLPAMNLEELKKNGMNGEKAFIIRTALLRSHKFPVFEGEKFVTDSYIYEQLDSEFKFLPMPYTTQICKYIAGGYSDNYRRLLFSNPKGYMAYHNQRIKQRRPDRVKSAICYDAIALRCGGRGLFSKSANPLLAAVVLPVGFLKYIYDSIKLKSFGRIC